ncbi:CotD family spore coat protein [Pontibacillus sp. HMF3514]|uniref:CotD family spore coat protein n=1 Tax=Pontibacillus sp. HMF3514 TaxID=2692425 RepID=UPI001F234CD7|nr:CotD family spore coat protein [Pontibacillus sp. HMF3514]
MRPRRMCGCGPRPQMVSPAQQKVYPTKQCVKHNFFQQEVDHIHPTHTTNVNHVNVLNKHFFPQSQSDVTQVSQQNVNMGPGSQVAGASTGPMGGPGMMGPGGPGQMGPGSQVAGASTGPMGGPGMMGPGQMGQCPMGPNQMGPMGMKPKKCGC